MKGSSDAIQVCSIFVKFLAFTETVLENCRPSVSHKVTKSAAKQAAPPPPHSLSISVILIKKSNYLF